MFKPVIVENPYHNLRDKNCPGPASWQIMRLRAVDIQVALFTTRADRGLLDNGAASYQFFERKTNHLLSSTPLA